MPAAFASAPCERWACCRNRCSSAPNSPGAASVATPGCGASDLRAAHRLRRGGLLLADAPGNAAAGEVIRGEFNLHPVTNANADEAGAHPTGDMGQHLMPALDLHREHATAARIY